MSGPVPESQWLGRQAPTWSLVRHITDFLQWRFSQLPPGAYRYAARQDGGVDESSEIHISASFPIRPDVIGMRPALTVFRSNAQFQGIGLGDRGFIDMASGAEMRADIIPLTLMVGVLSRLPVEAETLAFHVADQISGFRTPIIKTLPELFYIGNRPSLSTPSPPGAMVSGPDVDWTAVIVSFPAFLSYKHVVTPLNRPIVQGFDATIRTEDAQVVRPAPIVPLQGTSLGQPAPSPPPPSPIGPSIGAELPQTPSPEAHSTEPLSIKIEVR